MPSLQTFLDKITFRNFKTKADIGSLINNKSWMVWGWMNTKWTLSSFIKKSLHLTSFLQLYIIIMLFNKAWSFCVSADEIADLNDRYIGLQQTRDNEREHFELQIQQQRNEYQEMKDQLTSENMILGNVWVIYLSLELFSLLNYTLMPL